MGQVTNASEIIINDVTVDDLMRFSRASSLYLTINLPFVPYPRLIGRDGKLHEFDDFVRDSYWGRGKTISTEIVMFPNGSKRKLTRANVDRPRSLATMMQDAYDGYVLVNRNEMHDVASAVLKTNEALDDGDRSVASLTDDERRAVRDALDAALAILGRKALY